VAASECPDLASYEPAKLCTPFKTTAEVWVEIAYFLIEQEFGARQAWHARPSPVRPDGIYPLANRIL
jgi:hypothetical protein